MTEQGFHNSGQVRPKEYIISGRKRQSEEANRRKISLRAPVQPAETLGAYE